MTPAQSNDDCEGAVFDALFPVTTSDTDIKKTIALDHHLCDMLSPEVKTSAIY